MAVSGDMWRCCGEVSDAVSSSHYRPLDLLLKRCFDLIVAVLLLAVLAPWLAVISAFIRASDNGPVFYRALRAGRDGEPFSMLKFRTMVVGADQIGGSSTANDDVRVTKAGSILRRWKLDELPQLLNVVMGDMSLVGPRPQVLEEVATYTEAERKLLSVRPGITDWASVYFHDEGERLAGSDDPDAAYESLIRPGKSWLGLQYVMRASVRTDIGILVATISSIFGRAPRVPSIPDNASEQLGL